MNLSLSLTDPVYTPEQKDALVKEKIKCSVVTDWKSLYDMVTSPSVAPGTSQDRESAMGVPLLRGILGGVNGQMGWVLGILQIAPP